jgi:hypothetical protein
MRHTMPPLHEGGAALKARLHQAQDGPQQPRGQMRSLLASRHAHTRPDVARLLGGQRHTSSRGLASSAAGGLDALLATYVPAGNPVSLAPTVRASREQALRRPEGFASEEARRPWGPRPHGVEVTDQTLYTLVRPRVHATRTVARPRHTQKP